MTESAPQSESKYGSMVPEYIFDKTWQEQDFSIPEDIEARTKLRMDLEQFSNYGVMWLPENTGTRKILLTRIAAIEAYDAQMSRGKIKLVSRRERVTELSKELIQSLDGLPFPGIDPDTYEKIKADEQESLGYTTNSGEPLSCPIDDLVERFKNEGMKVVLGKYPESGSVFILPALSNDIENDSLSPTQLKINEDTKDKFKELISLQEKMRSFAPL